MTRIHVTQGMRLRYKDSAIDGLIVSFGNKVKNRICIVERLFTPMGGSQIAVLIFQKRGNRGKEFTEKIHVSEISKHMEEVTNVAT